MFKNKQRWAKELDEQFIDIKSEWSTDKYL